MEIRNEQLEIIRREAVKERERQEIAVGDYAASVLCLLVVLIMAGRCIYKAWKGRDYDRLPHAIQGGLWLLAAAAPSLAVWLRRPDLMGTLFALPMIGVYLHDALWVRRRYDRCVFPVNARYLGSRKLGRNRYRPRFSYTFDGELLEAESFVEYAWSTKIHLFEKTGLCMVYVDPDRPTHCVDKRMPLRDWFTYVIIGLLVWVGVSALMGNPVF